MAKQSSGLLGSLGFVKSPGAPVPHRKHTSACETVEMPVPASAEAVRALLHLPACKSSFLYMYCPDKHQYLHASDLYESNLHESNLQASRRNACGQNPYD